MTFRACAALLIGLLFATTAGAEDCGHLMLRASLDIMPTRADAVFVPVMINGAQTYMLLDTGGGISSLSARTVKALALTRHDAAMTLLDLTGNASRQFVHLDTLDLGGLRGKNIDLMIWPDPNAQFDGLIGGDLLSRYDVELNFVTRKLNIFSPDHCEGNVIYWPATALAVVPFSMSRPVSGNPNEPSSIQTGPDSHIRVPVTLDGKNFSAIIDTGATTTTMSASAAKTVLGVTAASPGAVPIGPASDNPGERRFGYVFHSLAFEGVAVSNPHVVIHPDLIGRNDPNNDFMLDSHINRVDDGMGADLFIGMDVLKHLHLYIAYHERKLYITPPDQPEAPVANR